MAKLPILVLRVSLATVLFTAGCDDDAGLRTARPEFDSVEVTLSHINCAVKTRTFEYSLSGGESDTTTYSNISLSETYYFTSNIECTNTASAAQTKICFDSSGSEGVKSDMFTAEFDTINKTATKIEFSADWFEQYYGFGTIKKSEHVGVTMVDVPYVVENGARILIIAGRDFASQISSFSYIKSSSFETKTSSDEVTTSYVNFNIQDSTSYFKVILRQ